MIFPSFELWFSIAAFAFVSLGTPGPNNIMLATSGANAGFLRTIPHMLGIASGCSALLFIVGVTRHKAVTLIPQLTPILLWVSLIMVVYLAYRIASARLYLTHNNSSTQASSYKVMTFWQAALFQWVNPKAWMIALMATSQHLNSSDQLSAQLVIMVVIFWCVTMITAPVWTWFGTKIAAFLRHPLKLRFFNVSMACLLIISVVPAVLHHF